MLKKIGSWVGSTKKYFSSVQKEIADVKDIAEDESLFDNDQKAEIDKKKDE